MTHPFEPGDGRRRAGPHLFRHASIAAVGTVALLQRNLALLGKPEEKSYLPGQSILFKAPSFGEQYDFSESQGKQPVVNEVFTLFSQRQTTRGHGFPWGS